MGSRGGFWTSVKDVGCYEGGEVRAYTSFLEGVMSFRTSQNKPLNADKWQEGSKNTSYQTHRWQQSLNVPPTPILHSLHGDDWLEAHSLWTVCTSDVQDGSQKPICPKCQTLCLGWHFCLPSCPWGLFDLLPVLQAPCLDSWFQLTLQITFPLAFSLTWPIALCASILSNLQRRTWAKCVCLQQHK